MNINVQKTRRIERESKKKPRFVKYAYKWRFC